MNDTLHTPTHQIDSRGCTLLQRIPRRHLAIQTFDYFRFVRKGIFKQEIQKLGLREPLGWVAEAVQIDAVGTLIEIVEVLRSDSGSRWWAHFIIVIPKCGCWSGTSNLLVTWQRSVTMIEDDPEPDLFKAGNRTPSEVVHSKLILELAL